MTPTFPQHGLYAITDGPRPDLVEAVRSALSGGARLLQYRDDSRDAARRLDEARALRRLCDEQGVPLIINGDAALAAAVGAAGVHLGEIGDDIAAARALLGAGAIIGMSCKGSLDLAKSAVASGADYVSFGAFFPSPTRPDASTVPIELLRQSTGLGVPRVAIGGITPDNAPALIAAGADLVASISSLFRAPDIRAAAQRFRDLFPTTDRDRS